MPEIKSLFLDANAVLRYLLKDIDEQFDAVNRNIKSRQCIISLEVVSEVAFVLDGLYHVPRDLTVKLFHILGMEVSIVCYDVFLRALEIYDKSPKLDFVDCLLYGYHVSRGAEILTFDKKLQKKLESE